MSAESTFDRASFASALRTRRLGHVLFARAEVDSTNDVAWELAQRGADDGTCVVAEVQIRGRGRHGRSWHTAPGHGLALSLLLHPGGDRAVLATVPLVAGLGLARALEGMGVAARLKWPNDLLVGGRKISGVLVESRRDADGADVVVMGVGVNVTQRLEDFPLELQGSATSLAREGVEATREQVAAGFLNALEPLWDEHQEGDPARTLEAWRRRAEFWGRPVSVTTPSGPVVGVARDLDERGGLVIEPQDGAAVTVYAGDLQVTWPEGAA
jgi:BirA family biotin operon repressor/biotin-[acetyl-CoA-carboxylase] ligase